MTFSSFQKRRRFGAAAGSSSLALIAAGIGSAFAVASCCALPIIFGGLGLSTPWLFHLAVWAAPHRTTLLGVALVALLAGAIMFFRQRRVRCAPDRWCSRPWVKVTTVIGLLIGIVLWMGGYKYV
jgi:mercuric ion transport protein